MMVAPGHMWTANKGKNSALRQSPLQVIRLPPSKARNKNINIKFAESAEFIFLDAV